MSRKKKVCRHPQKSTVMVRGGAHEELQVDTETTEETWTETIWCERCGAYANRTTRVEVEICWRSPIGRSQS